MTHFTEAELQRWRASDVDDDRGRVTEHLRVCAGCASRYADAVRAQEHETERTDDLSSFVEAGYAVAAPPRSRSSRSTVWVAGLAAAAALAVAVLVPRLRPEQPPELRLRGASVRALSPTGPVSGEITFAWASGLSAGRFHVEAGRGDTIVFAGDTPATQLRLPADRRASLSAGSDYWWTVSAIDGRGRTIATSPRQTFSIQPR